MARNLFSYFSVEPKKPSEAPEEDDEVQIITQREEEEVRRNLLELEEEKPAKRGKYRVWKLEEKVEIGSYANRTYVAKAVRDLSHKYPGLTKQSVSDFRKHASEPEKMKKKKQGRPTLLPEEIMTKTIKLVKALRLRGAPITCQVINSVARGIVEANDRSILIENGGYLTLNSQWGRCNGK